ncbi:DegV family protein [Chengkuizengella marina]|uniref:DegV family EDD domain-containing protein n=1 Tax=Chengkuizengella marina TaxID=2507566 RepID=A0A6N9PZY0_9BACL|nr:DegV family protein [Chengkuizengella marina]NBI29061.1 DegV family EDD domain-containing protein [Chengkuizengella marina]
MEKSQVHELIYKGAVLLSQKKDELNGINVYPIPDGDTGSNLSYLMKRLKECYETQPFEKANVPQLSDCIIRHSRGNSGAIFSQFLLRLLEGIEHEKFSYQCFPKLVEKSTKAAADSVAEPQEGTILTVMRKWAENLNQFLQDSKNESLEYRIQKSLTPLFQAVQETKESIFLWTKQNFVDAGALAFYYFIKGMTQKTKLLEVVTSEQTFEDIYESDDHSSWNEHDHRYCSEFLIQPKVSTNMIKKSLSSQSSSLIVVGNKKKIRIHCHTDDPEEIMESLENCGKVIEHKIEDMLRQYQAKHQRLSPIAIVVDSACDLPQEWMDKHHIHVLPIQIDLNDTIYFDKQTITPETFYNKLENLNYQPKTSMPSSGQIQFLYEQLLTQYDQIISLHVSQALSGTYQSCKNIASSIDSKRIHVVDSKNLSGTYGLLTHRLVNLIQSETDMTNILDQLNQWMDNTEILVSVPTLKHMVAGGRVSPLKGKIASLLNIKPIISLNDKGGSKLYSATFFRKSNLKKMFKLIQKMNKNYEIQDYVLLHANSPVLIQDMQSFMEKTTGKTALFTSNVSPVIGAHAGKGAVSIAMMFNKKNTRELNVTHGRTISH